MRLLRGFFVLRKKN